MTSSWYPPISQEIAVWPGILTTVDPEAFCGLKDLQTIKMYGNRLSVVPVIVPIKGTLRGLWLFENVISKISNDYFRNFSQLSTINLARNNLTHLPNLFWVEKSIKSIYISGNQIQSMDAVLGSGFYEALLYIDVSDNIISYLNLSSLGNCPKLTRLLINGNQLTSIADYRAYLGPKALVLYANPWHCDSELTWMIGVASSSLTCHSPECFAGQLVNTMSEIGRPR